MADLPIKPLATPWHAQKVEYRKATGLDVYGKPASYDSGMINCTARVTMVEVVDANATRGKRQGLVVETPPQSFFAINDHLVYDGEEYTIIGIDKPRTNILGRSFYVVLTAVSKRGNV